MIQRYRDRWNGLVTAVFYDGTNGGEVEAFLEDVATVSFLDDQRLEISISPCERIIVKAGEWVTIESEGDVYTYEADWFPESFTEDRS